MMELSSTPRIALDLRKGAVIEQGGQSYVITHTLSMTEMMVKEVATGDTMIFDVSKLESPRPASAASFPPRDRDLNAVDADNWAYATMLRAAIEQSLKARHGSAAYAALAKSVAVSQAQFYKLKKRYLTSGKLLSSLLHAKRIGGKGRTRLSPEVAAIVRDKIETFHLTEQKPSDVELVKEIHLACESAKLPRPSRSTILRHLDWVDQRERTKKREGAYAAEQQFDAIEGTVEGANWPLALVEMDHTELPVIIVDDKHRKPINRAWITVAIDCFSRVALGVYVTLDAPSALSAGVCIGNSILPKEKWLLDIAAGDGVKWPYYGTPDRLYMDNAKEFRGETIRRTCQEYRIDVEFRPVKKPRYGAHIERLMGTLSQKLKLVPGATFANPKQRGQYDSEKFACMTLAELERWLVLTFAEYHHTKHSSLGMTPDRKWQHGIFGTDKTTGRGIPYRHLDEERVRIDFMPIFERTIQPYGVLMDVHYFHDVLRSKIGLTAAGHSKVAPTFTFRRDPRDISHIYFFDEDHGRYVAIPYRDSSLPPASIWEWRAAKKLAIAEGVSPDDEREVFRLMRLQREVAAESSEKTKAARRAQQKLAEHAKVRAKKAKDLPVSHGTVAVEPTTPPISSEDDVIQPFTDD